jgi:hypothetical protein
MTGRRQARFHPTHIAPEFPSVDLISGLTEVAHAFPVPHIHRMIE